MCRGEGVHDPRTSVDPDVIPGESTSRGRSKTVPGVEKGTEVKREKKSTKTGGTRRSGEDTCVLWFRSITPTTDLPFSYFSTVEREEGGEGGL